MSLMFPKKSILLCDLKNAHVSLHCTPCYVIKLYTVLFDLRNSHVALSNVQQKHVKVHVRWLIINDTSLFSVIRIKRSLPNESTKSYWYKINYQIIDEKVAPKRREGWNLMPEIKSNPISLTKGAKVERKKSWITFQNCSPRAM